MSKINNFLKELLIFHPELHDFYNSEQYQLSVQLNEIMTTKCTTEEQIANLLNSDVNYINRLTSGDNTIDVAEYKFVISQLQDI